MNCSSQTSVQTPSRLGCCFQISQGVVLEEFSVGDICKLLYVLDSFRKEIPEYGHGTDSLIFCNVAHIILTGMLIYWKRFSWWQMWLFPYQ